jgi:hypothetical protein
MVLIRIAALTVVLALSGCANLPGDPGAGERGIDGQACTGSVDTAVSGLLETANPLLLTKTRLQQGKGGVCAARVFAVVAPVTLFRVFDASNPHSKFGSWWSLRRPSGTKDDYRAANAICKEWSSLDRVVACEIRPGTQVVIGTTQSAQCSDGSTYPQTAVNQVFVPNDGRAGIVHVGACGEEEAIWP